MSGNITKGLAGEQDLHRWDGTSDMDFTRDTSTGGTITLNDFGDSVDALITYGAGKNYTLATLQSLLTAIGTTNKVRVILRPGTWAITNDLTITSNICLRPVAGAKVTVSAGKTLTIQGPVEAGAYQWIYGTGTTTISTYPQDQTWWGNAERLDVTGLKVGSSVVSAFAQTLLDDANAAAIITTMGGAAALRTSLAVPAAIDLRGYLAGLGLSNAADADHDITIAVGTCRDSTNAATLTLASAMTKQIDAAWAAGTAAGGLDTGSVANSTFYYIFLIRKDSDGSIDALFSTSATSPTLPAGYTYFRRIGSLLTDGSANIRNGVWTGDGFHLNTFISDRNYAAVANTDRILITTSVPPGMIGHFMTMTGSASGTNYASSGPTTDADIAPSAYDDCLYTANTTHQSTDRYIKVDASSRIYVRGSSTNITYGVKTLGWIDTRGKDS